MPKAVDDHDHGHVCVDVVVNVMVIVRVRGSSFASPPLFSVYILL